MKNAASCETWCELQDTLSTDFSNAHCGLGSCPGPRLSEGRIRLAKEGSPSTWPHRIDTIRRLKVYGSSPAEKRGSHRPTLVGWRRLSSFSAEASSGASAESMPREILHACHWHGKLKYIVDLRSDEMTR